MRRIAVKNLRSPLKFKTLALKKFFQLKQICARLITSDHFSAQGASGLKSPNSPEHAHKITCASCRRKPHAA